MQTSRVWFAALLVALSAQFWAGPPALSAQDGEEATRALLGRVVDQESGEPIEGASVSLDARDPDVAGPGTRRTDEDGRFRFDDIPDGAYGLRVSSGDYETMADSLHISDEGDIEVLLRLSEFEVFEPLIVDPGLGPLPHAFEQRRRRSSRGFLITREDILERRVRYVSELLHEVPGGMVLPSPGYGYELRLRGQCIPGIWMDRVPMPGARSIDQIVNPGEVEAVEVFHSLDIPVEYGTHECGGIMIWTRAGPTVGPAMRTDDEGGGSNVLGRLATLAAVVAIVVFIAR